MMHPIECPQLDDSVLLLSFSAHLINAHFIKPRFKSELFCGLESGSNDRRFQWLLLADNGSTTRLSRLIRTLDGKSHCTLALINREVFLICRQIRRSHSRYYSKAADQNRTVQFVA